MTTEFKCAYKVSKPHHGEGKTLWYIGSEEDPMAFSSTREDFAYVIAQWLNGLSSQAPIITPDMVAEMRHEIGEVAVIVSEEHTSRRATFYVAASHKSQKHRLDAEFAMYRKWGNSPFSLYIDITMYRFTFVCV